MRSLPPLPISGPCFRRDANGDLQDATFSVIGVSPNNETRGVLYWAWSFAEASNVADIFRTHGYIGVRVCNENSLKTKNRVDELIFGED